MRRKLSSVLSRVLLTRHRPLSSIGMPYYREQLLSAWPSHLVFETGAPPTNLDQQLLSSMKTTEWGSFGRNTRHMRRNQVENTRTMEKASNSLQAPKFLSEKARESANDTQGERRISDVADAIGAAELSSLKAEVPVMYRNVEIKYSKFGVDDFDFGSVYPFELYNQRH
jgi:PAB-dependent poly(A)-specific ribonuclease subunit 2